MRARSSTRTNLAVAPGFIDVHTHADDLADHPRAENFVRMGVTTIVAGNCGGSALDVGEALTRIEQTGVSVNFATLVGHNTIRRAVMATDNRMPTLPELTKMRSLVWRAMTDGAVGFSTGLQYVPGTYAATPEFIELARVAGKRRRRLRLAHAERGHGARGGHRGNDPRRRGRRLSSPDFAPESGQPEPLGRQRRRRSALIDAARARGVAIAADQYAYTAASSSLGIRFPSWALGGRADNASPSASTTPPHGRRSRTRCAACSPNAVWRICRLPWSLPTATIRR